MFHLRKKENSSSTSGWVQACRILQHFKYLFLLVCEHRPRNTLKHAQTFGVISDDGNVDVKRSSRLTESCNGLWICVNIYRKIPRVRGQFKDATASLSTVYSGAFQRIPLRWCLHCCWVFQLYLLSLELSQWQVLFSICVCHDHHEVTQLLFLRSTHKRNKIRKDTNLPHLYSCYCTLLCD